MSSGNQQPFCLGLNVLKQHVRELDFHLQLFTWGPFYYHGLAWIPTWISKYIHYKVWDEITYTFPNFNGTAAEGWE